VLRAEQPRAQRIPTLPTKAAIQETIMMMCEHLRLDISKPRIAILANHTANDSGLMVVVNDKPRALPTAYLATVYQI